MFHISKLQEFRAQPLSISTVIPGVELAPGIKLAGPLLWQICSNTYNEHLQDVLLAARVGKRIVSYCLSVFSPSSRRRTFT